MTPDERAQGMRGELSGRASGLSNKLDARRKRLENGLIRDLRELGQNEQPPTLRREEPRGNIPPRRGYSEVNLQPGTGGGGTAGIASPLTEGNQAGLAAPERARTYHPAQEVMSTDGLFVWEAESIASMTMYDANGARVVFNIAPPRDPTP